MGWVQYDTAEVINSPNGCEFIIIVGVFLLSNFLHKHAIDKIRTISSVKKNLHYWLTGVATGMKISVLHSH